MKGWLREKMVENWRRGFADTGYGRMPRTKTRTAGGCGGKD